MAATLLSKPALKIGINDQQLVPSNRLDFYGASRCFTASSQMCDCACPKHGQKTHQKGLLVQPLDIQARPNEVIDHKMCGRNEETYLDILAEKRQVRVPHMTSINDLTSLIATARAKSSSATSLHTEEDQPESRAGAAT